MNAKILIAVFAVCLLLCAAAQAENEKVVYTKSGEKFTGTIIKQDEKLVTIRLDGGTVAIPASIVDRIVDLIEEARLQLLVIYDQKLANRSHEELRFGQDFTRLVKKYSQHLTFFEDGMTGFVERSYLPEKVAKFAFDLRKDGYTSPVKVEDAFYIIKMLEKRKTEKDPSRPEEPETPEPGPDEHPDEPVKERPPVKVRVLQVNETTREAKAASTGLEVRELLMAEVSSTTGFELFEPPESPEPGEESAPYYTITGEVAKAGPAYAVQFTLKDAKDREILTTDRLTAFCAEDVEDLVKAIKQLAQTMIREMKHPR